MASLNAVKDFPEYPKGIIDESAKEDRLDMYKDLLVARWNYQQLDEEFMNTGQAQAFKDNRKLMKALDKINRMQAEKEFIAVEDDLNENLDFEV